MSGSAVRPHASLILFPTKLAIKGIGKRFARTFIVKEPGYTGAFNTSETEGCIQAATLAPSVGNGPKTKFTLTGVKKVKGCSITFSDTNGHTAMLKFSVV
jgi:hypothetical protein